MSGPTEPEIADWFEGLKPEQQALVCALMRRGEFTIADTDGLNLQGADSPYRDFVTRSLGGNVRFSDEVQAWLQKRCPPPASTGSGV